MSAKGKCSLKWEWHPRHPFWGCYVTTLNLHIRSRTPRHFTFKGANETFSIQTTYLPFFVIRARNWEKRFTTELRFLMRSFVKLLRFVFVTLFRSGRTVRTTSSQTSWLRGLKCNWHLSRVWTKSSCFLWSQAVRIENLICQQPPHCGLGYTLEHHAKDQAI